MVNQSDLLITTTTLAYGGEALGRLPDGRAVFVPFTLPGEMVRVRLVEEKRGFARAELLEVVEAAPERIPPRCIHFEACGGCQYQHMPYEVQLQAKTDILRDQLQRIGGLVDPPVQSAVPSPQTWNYRNHVQFHLTTQGKLGYHAARSDEVISIQECHLPETILSTLWPLLEIEPIPELARVSLRSGAAEDALLILEGTEPEPPEVVIDLPISAVYLGPAGPRVLAGSDYLVMEVLGRLFHVSAGSFFQVNTLFSARMVEHLLTNLPLKEDSTLVEVYCGVGLFSAFLSPLVGRLVAIESSEVACDDFMANLEEFSHVDLYQGRAEDVLPFLEIKPEIVLVDPPRAGLGRQVLDAILALAPAILAYVSCDPATLARDARRLVEAGYSPINITPFDLFPQTYHIESISIWEKNF